MDICDDLCDVNKPQRFIFYLPVPLNTEATKVASVLDIVSAGSCELLTQHAQNQVHGEGIQM